jgi:hypothetical protein
VIKHATNRIAYVECLLVACAVATVGAGCGAEVYPQPVAVYSAPVEGEAVIYVDAPPPNIEVYPHAYYGGADVYLVEGRWYQRGPHGWGYYREEPAELARRRPDLQAEREREHVQGAPPAERERERSREQAAPVERERPNVQQAPAPVERERPAMPPPPVVERQRPAAPPPPARPARVPVKRVEPGERGR